MCVGWSRWLCPASTYFSLFFIFFLFGTVSSIKEASFFHLILCAFFALPDTTFYVKPAKQLALLFSASSNTAEIFTQMSF